MKTKKKFLDLINDEAKFKQACFPEIFELERSFQELEESIKKTQECAQGLENGFKLAKILSRAKIL